MKTRLVHTQRPDGGDGSLTQIPPLPQEIISQIVDIVAGNNDRYALKSCSTVSRSWTYSSQRHLFSAISLKPIHPSQLSAYPHNGFLAVLKHSPHLGGFIQELKIITNFDGRDRLSYVFSIVNEAIPHLWQLRTIVFIGCDEFVFHSSSAPGDQDLFNAIRTSPTINNIIFKGGLQPTHLIRNLGQLKRLEFIHASFVEVEPLDQSLHSLTRNSATTTRPKSILISSDYRLHSASELNELGGLPHVLPPAVMHSHIDLSKLSTLSLHLQYFSWSDVPSISALIKSTAEHLEHVQLWLSRTGMLDDDGNVNDVIDLSPCAALVSLDLSTDVNHSTSPYESSLTWLVGVLSSIKSPHLSFVTLYFAIQPVVLNELSQKGEEGEDEEDDARHYWESLDLLLARMQDELNMLKIVMDVRWYGRVQSPDRLHDLFADAAFPAVRERGRLQIRRDRENDRIYVRK